MTELTAGPANDTLIPALTRICAADGVVTDPQ